MKNKISKTLGENNTRDHFTAVLENIESKVQEVAEGVVVLNEKMERGFDEVNGKFEKVNENLQIVRTEISLIRHNQITRDEFKALEDRVFSLEKKIAK